MEVPGEGGPRTEAEELERLGELVKTLRARCPWDMRQTHLSLAPHLLEEAYETIDVIEALAAAEPEPSPGLVSHLEEELGDVLFQVFFHCELASEEGRFGLVDVARGIHDKLVSRHPHVFGDVSAETSEEVAARWEVLKKSEKERRGVADSLPEAMPALALATKLLKKSDSLGAQPVSLSDRSAAVTHALDVLRLERSKSDGSPTNDLVQCVGAAVFALADLARRSGVDPEMALRAFALRFREDLEAASD